MWEGHRQPLRKLKYHWKHLHVSLHVLADLDPAQVLRKGCPILMVAQQPSSTPAAFYFPDLKFVVLWCLVQSTLSAGGEWGVSHAWRSVKKKVMGILVEKVACVVNRHSITTSVSEAKPGTNSIFYKTSRNKRVRFKVLHVDFSTNYSTISPLNLS